VATFCAASTAWVILIFVFWGLNKVRETLRDNPEPTPTTGEWRRLRVTPVGEGHYLVKFEYRLGLDRWAKGTLATDQHHNRTEIQERVESVIRDALIARALTERLSKGKIVHDYRL